MILHWCPACGVYRPGETEADHGPAKNVSILSARVDCEGQPLLDWDAEAIRAWQEEIAATCAHVPRCGGPWQHAWYSLKEVLIAREAETDRTASAAANTAPA